LAAVIKPKFGEFQYGCPEEVDASVSAEFVVLGAEKFV
jgi:hypothetical protein